MNLLYLCIADRASLCRLTEKGGKGPNKTKTIPASSFIFPLRVLPLDFLLSSIILLFFSILSIFYSMLFYIISVLLLSQFFIFFSCFLQTTSPSFSSFFSFQCLFVTLSVFSLSTFSISLFLSLILLRLVLSQCSLSRCFLVSFFTLSFFYLAFFSLSLFLLILFLPLSSHYHSSLSHILLFSPLTL